MGANLSPHCVLFPRLLNSQKCVSPFQTGLYYNRARMYGPGIERFLQTDPVGYEDDLNLYQYTRNDPLNGRDPTGREVVLSGTPEDIELTRQALGYLSGSETFRNEYGVLEQSDTMYELRSNPGSGINSYADGVIEFDPYAGNQTREGVTSPALGLGHEVGHAAQEDRVGAAQFRESLAQPMTVTPTNEGLTVTLGTSPEEARATNVQNQMARELGEPQRQNYRDAGPVTTMGPTSRQPCPSPSGGTCPN
jgi:hypothetical protein